MLLSSSKGHKQPLGQKWQTLKILLIPNLTFIKSLLSSKYPTCQIKIILNDPPTTLCDTVLFYSWENQRGEEVTLLKVIQLRKIQDSNTSIWTPMTIFLSNETCHLHSAKFVT